MDTCSRSSSGYKRKLVLYEDLPFEHVKKSRTTGMKKGTRWNRERRIQTPNKHHSLSRLRRSRKSHDYVFFEKIQFKEIQLLVKPVSYNTEEATTDSVNASNTRSNEICGDTKLHKKANTTTEPTDWSKSLPGSSINPDESKKLPSTLKPVHLEMYKPSQRIQVEKIISKGDHELDNCNIKATGDIEKKSENTYKTIANIEMEELLNPGQFKSNIAAITRDDFKILISSIGVSTSSTRPKAQAMLYVQIKLGETKKECKQIITIQSVINESSKELDGTKPATFIMDGSKSHYNFMTSLASIDELTDIHETHLSIHFEISITPV